MAKKRGGKRNEKGEERVCELHINPGSCCSWGGLISYPIICGGGVGGADSGSGDKVEETPTSRSYLTKCGEMRDSKEGGNACGSVNLKIGATER